MRFFNFFPLRYFCTFKYQTALIIITMTFLISTLYVWTYKFYPLETPISVTPITQETIKSWGTDPVRVKTGMTITHVLEFDPTENNFLMTAIVWFIFDPKKVSQETIDKFSFLKGTIEQKQVEYQKLDDGNTLALYKVWLRFYATLDFARFPFDDHYITLRLTNELFNPREVAFESEKKNLIYMKKIYLPGWFVSNIDVQSGYQNWPLGIQGKIVNKEQAIVDFGIGFPTTGMNNVLLIMVPLLILFFIQLLTFATKPVRDILDLTTLSFAGFIAYTYIVQEVSPKVVQFLVSDYLLFFFFMSSFFVFLINMIFLHFREVRYEELGQDIKGGTIIFLHLTLNVMWYYFLFFYLTKDTSIQNVVTVW